MALILVSAKDYRVAREKINSKDKKSYLVEPKGLQSFFFDYQSRFVCYEIYYRFNPHGISSLPHEEVKELRVFVQSVERFIQQEVSGNLTLENSIIAAYNLSPSKIKKYLCQLETLCNRAIHVGENIIGIGD